MKVWQIATGEAGRDYRELFFAHDLMILGPGELGDATSNDYFGAANSHRNQVHRFADVPRPGDRVLMRFGKEVIGVGEIPTDDCYQYSYEETFNCVYGWNLSHCRRVAWAKKSYNPGKLASVYHKAKQKPSFTRVHESHIVDLIESIEKSHFRRKLKQMPQIDPSVYTEEELGVELFRAGISQKNVEDITRALQQAARLCSWYESSHCGRDPTEFEIVAHIVCPLFLGLGWSHQQIAVEWNKVDVAFFKKTPTTAEACVLILEAKGLGTALSDVCSQPQQYVNKLGLDNVKVILTTDGPNLFMYRKRGKDWEPNPSGYLNVTTLRKHYILPRNTSLVDTLVSLQPTSIS